MSASVEPVRPREIAATFVLYLAISVWWLWPLPAEIASHVPNQHPEANLVRADLDLILWALACGAHAFVTAPWDLFHANSFHPATSSLAYSEHLLGFAPIFAPVYWISGNPVLSANVVILLLAPLRGASFYLFARLYVPPPAAALAGLLFGFSPWMREELVKFHVHGVFYLPAAFYFTERWLQRARVRDAVALSVLLLLQAATSFYVAFAQMLGYGAFLLVELGTSLRSLDRRRVFGLLLACGVAAAGVAALGIPYLALQRLGVVPAYGLDAGDTPTGLFPYLALLEVWKYLSVYGIGAIGYALVAVGLAPPWRGRARPLAISIAWIAIGLLIALGPQPMIRGWRIPSPYPLLMEWLPGFSSIRLPSRFLFVAHLGFCLLAALGMARLVASVSRRSAWVAVAAASLLALALQPLTEIPLRRADAGEAVTPAHRWLAEHGDGRALLELPRPSWPEAARRMLLSTAHWLPIVDGYSGYTIETDDFLHDLAARLPDEESLQELVDHADIGWVVVHTSRYPPKGRQRWSGPFPPGLTLRATLDDDLVFQVERAPKRDRRALLLSATQTLEGRPRQILGPACPGQLELATTLPERWPADSPVLLEAEVRNLSTEDWPAAGIVPERLLRLRTCFRSKRRLHCRAPVRLPADVPAGQSIRVAWNAFSPPQPGKYTLVVELFQVGGRPLAECGLAPLELPVRVSRKDPAAPKKPRPGMRRMRPPDQPRDDRT
ncbi:MAG: hypothetical protein FJ144_26000 [Deltaproteobacteria bacterium]|nr:hypothetical protein [Deltaproteobacteria bacterium]